MYQATVFRWCDYYEDYMKVVLCEKHNFPLLINDEVENLY